MASYSERFTEVWQLLDTIYAANVAANTETNSGYVNCANMARIVIIVHPLSLNDALDIDIEEGTTTGGAGAQSFDAAGKDIAVAAADTKPSVIEIKGEEFDAANNYDCLNIEVTTANTQGSSNYFVVEVWGMTAYAPASTTNLDSVTD
jgi:hypothetical protein